MQSFATLADSDEAGFGFDDDDVRRLVHHRLVASALCVARIAEVTDDLDLVVAKGKRVGRRRQPSARPERAEPRQNAASIPVVMPLLVGSFSTCTIDQFADSVLSRSASAHELPISK
jgi:hypothetical protein